MDVNNIVILNQIGRFTHSNEKELQIEMQVAHYLGVLQRSFLIGLFDENLIENVDETHFVVNMGNGRTLGFMGDNVVKYVDIVLGGESMIMVVRIS